MVSLNDGWLMLESRLNVTHSEWGSIINTKEGWYECDLPTDVRMPLLREDVIKEPLKADYCFESEWIEKRAWWFKKEFDGASVDMNSDVIFLVLEGLDSKADIIFNGTYIGSHYSVHYPFKCDIKDKITDGVNTILIRMTTGLEEVSDADLAEINYAVCMEQDNGGKFRSDKRRAFVRRPQYTVGWDWGPKVVTCGITGCARLVEYKEIAIREVNLETLEAGEDAKLHLMINVESFSYYSSKVGGYAVEISYDGKKVYEKKCDNLQIDSGYNYFDQDIEIKNAKLWWPNGYGQQPLYAVKIKAFCNGVTEEWPDMKYGIRTVRIDTSAICDGERRFELIVNNKRIFCKGGNWIPNDFIYARVSEEKYHVLTDEAIEANFNMMRVWGGGLYERDLFYELCDRKGILLWHDLMFACATLPDHREQFRNLVRKELDFQTKRLRNHCCIGLFCGSNEVHWLFNPIDNPHRGTTFTYEHPYGMYLMNILAKEIMRANCPSIPYWNSSPYGGELPNDESCGDVHHWPMAFMSKKMEERIEPKDYDKVNAKFVSEYGYIGPCCRQTIEEYLDGNEPDRSGKLWWWHNNVFEKDTVHTAIEKNYVDNADKLPLDDYIVYGGMVHGLMYGYSLEAFKFKKNCFGSIFWMYNDAWGEVGWTIIDYYLRRKIPFYAVKRALAHRRFAMRAVDGNVVLQGVNDLPEDYCVKAKIGYVSFDGTDSELRDVQLNVPAGTRDYILTEKLPDKDYTKGTIMLYVEDDSVDDAWLRVDDMRSLVIKKSNATITNEKQNGDDRVVTVTSDAFAHGVYVEGGYKCSDNYFDLLPGQSKEIIIRGIGNNKTIIKTVI